MKSDDERIYSTASIAHETAAKLLSVGEYFVAMITIDDSGVPFVCKHEKVDDDAFIAILEKLLDAVERGTSLKLKEPTIN